ncbi:MAG: hypothetical protein JJU28_04925 [Cyclobacteriaceae bacterium]|nr:hypothetical protein [Cyclobacteriaceae bacterium]
MNSTTHAQKQIQIIITIHWVMLLFLVMFMLLIYFLTATTETAPAADLDNVFRIVIPAFGLGSIFLAQFLYKNQISSAKNRDTLAKKISGFQSAQLIKNGILEAPALLAIVVYMLTENIAYYLLAGLIILIFLMHKPTSFKVATDLELSPEERAEINMNE